MISTKRRKEERQGRRKERREGERKGSLLAWHIGFQINFYSGVQIMSAGSHLFPSLGHVFYLMDFKLKLCEA